MSMLQLDAMLAECDLEPTEAEDLLARDLDSLADLAAPHPSPELAALFGELDGVTSLAAPARWRRTRNTVASAVVLAVATVGATGLSAAANTLPPPWQRQLSELSHRYLPFEFPLPHLGQPGTPQAQPTHPDRPQAHAPEVLRHRFVLRRHSGHHGAHPEHHPARHLQGAHTVGTHASHHRPVRVSGQGSGQSGQSGQGSGQSGTGSGTESGGDPGGDSGAAPNGDGASTSTPKTKVKTQKQTQKQTETQSQAKPPTQTQTQTGGPLRPDSGADEVAASTPSSSTGALHAGVKAKDQAKDQSTNQSKDQKDGGGPAESVVG